MEAINEEAVRYCTVLVHKILPKHSCRKIDIYRDIYAYHNLKTSRNDYRFGAANDHVGEAGNEDGENVTGTHVVRNRVG